MADYEPRMLLKTISSAPAARRAGSHAGSHTDEQPWDAPDPCGQPGETSPRPRTDLNEAGRPRWYLRIRRSSARQAEGASVLAGLRSGDGPLSVRVRPSSLKRDCDRRATSTGERCQVHVHAKSRLTPEPLRTLRPETTGQGQACPDRTRPSPARCGRSPGSLQARRPQIRAYGLGTIWGPHVALVAGQPACDRTTSYARTTPLSCEDAYPTVLGVKGSRVQIPPSRLVRGVSCPSFDLREPTGEPMELWFPGQDYADCVALALRIRFMAVAPLVSAGLIS